MFNVSYLLLNDALKPATPLTNDHTHASSVYWASDKPECSYCGDTIFSKNQSTLISCSAEAVFDANVSRGPYFFFFAARCFFLRIMGVLICGAVFGRTAWPLNTPILIEPWWLLVHSRLQLTYKPKFTPMLSASCAVLKILKPSVERVQALADIPRSALCSAS